MNYVLSGTAVSPDGPWNQQWTSRYGTALAFLVRLAFVTCADTAFVQRQWFNLSTNRRTIRIRDLDVLSNALSAPAIWFWSEICMDYSLLSLVALISWALPFAVIITPGTLSVEPMGHSYIAEQPALQLGDSGQFVDDQNFFGFDLFDYSGTHHKRWSGESAKMDALAFASATSSQIIPMKSDTANQTYFLDFVGPALKCAEVNSSMQKEIKEFAWYNGLSYLAWMGDPPWSTAGNASFRNITLQNYAFQTSVPDIYDTVLEAQTEIPNTLWIARSYDEEANNDNYTAVECQLWNASYKIEFTFQNFEQNLTLHDFAFQAQIMSISTSDNQAYNRYTSQTSFPKYILAAYGSLLVGTSIQNETEKVQRSYFDLLNIDPTGSAAQLSTSVEEIFQNITLSLFSVPIFWIMWGNDTTESKITVWSNTYVYDRQNLLLAYGLALGAALMCCGVGIHSFFKNGSSFQNSFSTYIRAAEGSNLNIGAIFSVGDTGADPLPKKIGDKMITMAS